MIAKLLPLLPIDIDSLMRRLVMTVDANFAYLARPKLMTTTIATIIQGTALLPTGLIAQGKAFRLQLLGTATAIGSISSYTIRLVLAANGKELSYIGENNLNSTCLATGIAGSYTLYVEVSSVGTGSIELNLTPVLEVIE